MQFKYKCLILPQFLELFVYIISLSVLIIGVSTVAIEGDEANPLLQPQLAEPQNTAHSLKIRRRRNPTPQDGALPSPVNNVLESTPPPPAPPPEAPPALPGALPTAPGAVPAAPGAPPALPGAPAPAPGAPPALPGAPPALPGALPALPGAPPAPASPAPSNASHEQPPPTPAAQPAGSPEHEQQPQQQPPQSQQPHQFPVWPSFPQPVGHNPQQQMPRFPGFPPNNNGMQYPNGYYPQAQNARIQFVPLGALLFGG